jgi:NitT/TauT family transport system substrate-binding protein
VVSEAVSSLADLKGKRVGVDLRAAGMYLLTCALERAGIKSSDLELVPLNLPETQQAFTGGEVDAVVSSEPWLTGLRAEGGRSLFDSSQANTPLYRVLVVSQQALHDQREDVVRVVRAHFAMMKELRKHAPVPGLDMILRRQALSQAQFFNCWDRLKSFDVSENLALIGGGAQGLEKATASVEEKMRSNALLYRPVSARAWIDGSLLKEVQ